MENLAIRFDDGAAYERMMGRWSRVAGEIFLDWLQPATGQHWVDVGCGNGAFAELVTARCAPQTIDGVDPSEGQLAYARQRHTADIARFHQGGAESLPFADGHFDVAAMALVIFFVPDPARGVAEMRRVVRPTGTVCAYAWDMPGGGFPFEVIMQELAAAGIKPPRPPRAEVSALGALEALWHESGLEQIRTRAISVTRTFVDFEEFWSSSLSGTAGQVIRALPSDVVKRVKDAVLAQMPSDSAGRVTRTGVANAVSGLVPG